MPKFHPDYCLNCGHSLDGLPVAHRCPECGTAYDEHVVMWRAARPWKLLFVALGLGPGLFCFFEFLPDILGRTSSPAWLWSLGILAMGFSVVSWVMSVMKYSRDRRLGLGVWIDSRGVGVRDGKLDRVIPWNEFLKAERRELVDRRSVKIQSVSGSIVVTEVFAEPEEVTDFLEELKQARRRYDPKWSESAEEA